MSKYFAVIIRRGRNKQEEFPCDDSFNGAKVTPNVTGFYWGLQGTVSLRGIGNYAGKVMSVGLRMTRRRDLMCDDIFICDHKPTIPISENGEIIKWRCTCGKYSGTNSDGPSTKRAT